MPASRQYRLTVIAAALGVTTLLAGCGETSSVRVASVSTESPNPSTTGNGVSATPSLPPSPSPTPKPRPTATRPPAPTKTTTAAGCPQTSRQKDLETALAAIGTYGTVVVDGRQSASDCATIKKFQKRMGIYPANGSAGPTTVDVANRIAATDTSACNAGTATMACVDLTHQTFYIMKAGSVVLGPTVTRTGMPGFATPAGTFTINDRSTKSWSRPYKVWLPYWQNFYNGDGLHETTTYIHTKSIGSHGCVNLLHGDAVTAYSLLKLGSKVRLYGRRPGT